MNERIEIWTDGGCLGNPGPGGWAFVVQSGGQVQELSGFDANTTNNRMELTAVREALQMLSAQPSSNGRPVTLHTDSQYVQKGITQWIHAWARNGWKTSAKKPVKNSELWHALWDLSRSFSISWVWVMGHAGNVMNERCDFLVQEAIGRGLKRAP
ncbi:MAG: ribonuclease HI [Spirochaetia bacterium]